MASGGGTIFRAGLRAAGGIIVCALLAAGGMALYRQHALAALIGTELAVGQTVAHALAEPIWEASRQSTDVPGTSRPGIVDARALGFGARIISLRAFDREGRAFFARGPVEGAPPRPEPAFRRALAGAPAGDVLTDSGDAGAPGAARALAVSFLPYRASGGGAVDAVFEVRSDVREALADIGRRQWQLGGAIFGGTVLLLSAMALPLLARAKTRARRQDRREQSRERRLHYEATHDPLTQLFNRRSFHHAMEETIRRAEVSGRSFGVMFVDLDRFKLVNDSLGHKAGDQVLATVSERLASCMRRGDTVYRMGGDEFTVILGDLARPEDAVPVARRINRVLSEPLAIRQHEVAVGASIGIAVYPGDGEMPDLLLRNADAAMYAAKEAGRGGFAFYAPQMNARYAERLALEAMLRQAVNEHRFLLHYQLRFCARTEAPVGVEALLRWRHPRLGIMPPSGFIGILEDTGLILRVGAWVLYEACRQGQRWLAAGRRLRVSVNVSARQFRHEHFTGLVRKVLADTGLPPELLELELTESVLMDDSDATLETMREIRRLGVSLSIDDFGTGYSSLSYLARLPVDYLKIDRTFVAKALTSERDDAVVSAITVLARSLGMSVVAEGVENAQQALFLRTMGCTELQGNFLGVPCPAEELSFAPLPAVGEAARTANRKASNHDRAVDAAGVSTRTSDGSVS